MNWKKNLLSFLLGLSGVFMKAQNPVSLTVEYLYPFHHGRQPEKCVDFYAKRLKPL